MGGRQISDSQWRQIEDLLPGRPGSVGVTARDNRLFVDEVLWVLPSGAEWKDLPEECGKWKTCHKRYARWARAGIWKRVFRVLPDDPDNRYVMIDSTIVGTHQQAACGKGGPG
jgi:putative transposase